MLQQLTIKIFCISQPNFGTLFHEHHCTGLLVQFGKAGMGSLDSFFNFSCEMLMRRSTNIEFKTCCGIKTCNSMEKLHLGLQNAVVYMLCEETPSIEIKCRYEAQQPSICHVVIILFRSTHFAFSLKTHTFVHCLHSALHLPNTHTHTHMHT